jgi:hypothetical protein
LQAEKKKGFEEDLERSPGSLAKWSTYILPVAEDIQSIQNQEHRQDAFVLLLHFYVLLISAEALCDMAQAIRIRNRDRMVRFLKGAYFSNIPSTLSLLANMTRTLSAVEPDMLRDLAETYFHKAEETRKELTDIVRKTASIKAEEELRG